MTNGGADPRLKIGYLVHAVAPPPPPSSSRPPPLPRRGAVPRPPPAHAGLVLPPLRLRPLGGSGGGGGGGGRSVAATLAPRLWSPAPVLTAGVGRPAAAGGVRVGGSNSVEFKSGLAAFRIHQEQSRARPMHGGSIQSHSSTTAA